MTGSLPSISVIIPTLNRRELIQRALGSVFDQSLQVKEVIVVDNGSTDGTREMLSSKFPTVLYVSEKKVGVSTARNTGISLAKGDWIALLDSDDAWLPNKLEKQIAVYFENANARLIHTNEIWYRRGVRVNPMKKHKKRGGNIFEFCLPLCCISPSSVLLRRDLIEDVGLFDEELPACEDYDMWLRITSREPVLYLDEAVTVKYGGHEDQLSTKYWGMDRFRVYSIEKLLKDNLLTASQRLSAYEMLLKKLDIIIQGGRKRGKDEMVDFYSKKRSYWTHCGGDDDFLDRKVLS